MIFVPSGENVRDLTQSVCPVNGFDTSPVSTSHTQIVSTWPSGGHALPNSPSNTWEVSTFIDGHLARLHMMASCWKRFAGRVNLKLDL